MGGQAANLQDVVVEVADGVADAIVERHGAVQRAVGVGVVVAVVGAISDVVQCTASSNSSSHEGPTTTTTNTNNSTCACHVRGSAAAHTSPSLDGVEVTQSAEWNQARRTPSS